MKTLKYAITISAILFCCVHLSRSDHELQAIEKILSQCTKKSPQFDACIKQAFNELRLYFKRGIPEKGVASFDPHFAAEVKQKRKIFGLDYTLVLRNVYERGWTQSLATKYKTDWENAAIVYSQYFPEKFLEGQYEFRGAVLGSTVARFGHWNLTLRDYAQSTRVTRSSTGVSVAVEINHLGDMDIHISNLLQGKCTLEKWLDIIINTIWKPGFVVVRPIINELVSTAFTDIWSKSFKYFRVEQLIKD